jgi:3-oxoacyl-[acyl-carrier protein] reductase
VQFNDIRNKAVLVTGAASGIGRAIAVAFAEQGARVAINHAGRTQDALITAQAVDQAGGLPLVIEADVSQREQVRGMVAEVIYRFGGIDVLVNNAGIVLVKPFLETTPDDWQQVIDIDLTSVFHTCQAVLPHMLANAGGCIINVASELAFLGRDRYCAYTAAKGGVVTLTRSLAREFAPTIRVNALAPGPTDTAMLASELTTPELVARETDIPLRRIADPREIAGTAVFLASDQASFYCGDTLSPNGGALMR